MTYTPSASDGVTWSFVIYGAPLLLFLLLLAIALHQFDYRMWRLQLWLHRLSCRFRARGGRVDPHSLVVVGGVAHLVDGVPVDARTGFDAQGHWHDLTQDAPRARLANAPMLAYGIVLLMIVPFVLLLAWAVTLWASEQSILLALALVLMTWCCCSLYYAVMYWKTGGWRMTRHILYLFFFSLSCYFGLAFALSFLSAGVSFFGLSVHFLTLNYVLLTELISRIEAQRQIPAKTILQADKYFTHGDKDGDGDATAETVDTVLAGGNVATLSKAEQKKLHREAEKKFFAKFKQQYADEFKRVKPNLPTSSSSTLVQRIRIHPADSASGNMEARLLATALASPSSPSADADADSDFGDGDGEEDLADSERALRHEDDLLSGAATLINIHASKVRREFQDVLYGFIHEEQEAQVNVEKKGQIKLYGLSLLVLLGYSLMIYSYSDLPLPDQDQTTDPSTGASVPQSASSGHKYLGFIVSGILLVWDTLVYLYAFYCGRVLNNATRIIVLAGSRVALVSFGFQGWFLGVTCLYAGAGVYLVYQLVDRRLPWDDFSLNSTVGGGGGKAKRVQRFNEFCRSLTNPEHEEAVARTAGESNALLRTISRKGSSIGIAEFVLLILTVLFFMALCVSYRTNPPAQSLEALGDELTGAAHTPWQQYEIGVIVWYVVFLWLLALWTIRLWMKQGWRFGWGSLALSIVTESAFIIGGVLIFRRTSSVILLVGMVCGPIFVLSCLGTYQHCLSMDWHFLRPSRSRNPPEMPFLLALLSLGLPREDYRMIWNVVVTFAMTAAIGLGVTFGMGSGSSVGWSITFVLLILITSIVPLVKYLKTLTLDRVDVVLLCCWFVAHTTFFGLQYGLNGSHFTPRQSFALWGCAIGYPVLLANILAYYSFRENANTMSKNTARIFAFTFCLIILFVVIIFFTLGTNVGWMILSGLAYAAIVSALFVRWVSDGYTLSRTLRGVSLVAFGAVMVAGIVLGVALPDEDAEFWAYSGSWWLLTLYIAIVAYGDKRRLEGKLGASSTAVFRYSEHLFPVYYFDRRNETNPVQSANRHAGLICATFLMSFGWCAACMVTSRINIGLGISALTILSFYTFLRTMGVASNKALMYALPFLDSGVVARSRSTARDSQLAGAHILFDDPDPALASLAKWGRIIHQMLLDGLDPLPTLKRKQKALRKVLGIGRSCFCAPLHLRVPARQLDEYLLLLEYLNEWSFLVAGLQKKFESHFYFLLLGHAQTVALAEESKMKNFCLWVRREKRSPPPAAAPVDIDPTTSNFDVYDAPLHWSQARILAVQEWKREYDEVLREQQRKNEENKAMEEKAQAERERILAEREERLARQEEEREEAERQAAAAAGQVSAAAGAGPPSLSPADSIPPTLSSDTTAAISDPTVRAFWTAVKTFRETGKVFEDPDFPCSDESLYLTPEPTPGKMRAPVDGWMRPKEILAALAAANPDQNISLEPRVFIDGFDLTDIKQGSLGTCYFLSALGCLGLREKALPRYPLLTDMFTMEFEGATYNNSGAFLIRFYRQGRVQYVLIDDRLPTSQGNFIYSHCRDPAEVWLPLLEKAYARLFGCFEAIEAGSIAQALADLSNGASEAISLKDKNGNIAINQESMWSTLEESAKEGYLMGAGSNSGSDSNWVEGIAQGHAYMMTRIFADSAQTEKLLQLQNPHGAGEWTGDWSDNSPKWTQWWRNTLLTGDPVDDGKFFMAFQDFLAHYQNVYICRLLPTRQCIKSNWNGHTATGPSRPFHSPTFTVKARAKPCKIWIELEQKAMRGKHALKPDPEGTPAKANPNEPLTPGQKLVVSANGYAYILFCVVESNGKRVTQLTKDSVKLASNKWVMMNERQVSAEFFLEVPDIPYTIVALTKHARWETDFSLSVFSADDTVEFKQLPEEDPSATGTS